MDRGSARHARSRKAVWGRRSSHGRRRRAGAARVGCGDVTRQGTALVVPDRRRARGRIRRRAGRVRRRRSRSDVVTVVDDVPTIFNDLGRVTFALAMKDPAAPTRRRRRRRTTSSPSTATACASSAPTAATRRASTCRTRSTARHRDRAAATRPGRVRRCPHPGEGRKRRCARWRATARHHLDDRRGHVLRPRPDRPRGQRDRQHLGQLRQLRRPELGARHGLSCSRQDFMTRHRSRVARLPARLSRGLHDEEPGGAAARPGRPSSASRSRSRVTRTSLPQDGASQSLVTVTARDANAQPLRNVTLRAETRVDGTPVDFGSALGAQHRDRRGRPGHARLHGAVVAGRGGATRSRSSTSS